MSQEVDTSVDELLELRDSVNNLILDSSIGRNGLKGPQTAIRAVSQQRQQPERSIKIPPSQIGSGGFVRPTSATPQMLSKKLSQVVWLSDTTEVITQIGDHVSDLAGRQVAGIVVTSLTRFDNLSKSHNSELLETQQQISAAQLNSATAATTTLQQQMAILMRESTRRMSIIEKECNHRLCYSRKMKQIEIRLVKKAAEAKIHSAAIQLSDLKIQLVGVVDAFRSISKPNSQPEKVSEIQKNEAAVMSFLQKTLSTEMEPTEGILLSKQFSSSSRHLSDVSTPTDALQQSFPSSQTPSVGYSYSLSDYPIELSSTYTSPTSQPLSTQVGYTCSSNEGPMRCFGVLSSHECDDNNNRNHIIRTPPAVS